MGRDWLRAPLHRPQRQKGTIELETTTETAAARIAPAPGLNGTGGLRQIDGTPRADPRRDDRLGPELQQVTNAVVQSYKERLGRGPTKARSDYAGPDTLVATIEDSLTAAERNLIALGQHAHVRDGRRFLQHASARDLVRTVERITGRTVRAVVSETDTHHDVCSEIFYFQPVAIG